MPVKTTYRHHNVSEPNKKTFTVNQFRGVDYTPGQLNIDDYHATDISNVIYKDRVNQKRNGWEQVGKIGAITYSVKNEDGSYSAIDKVNSTNINGVWTIKVKGYEYTIAHVGRLLFLLRGLGKGKSFLDLKVYPLTTSTDDYQHVVGIELNDAKSNAYYGDGRLYILDGENYIVLKIEIDKYTNAVSLQINLVEDDDETYIPTTTVGITYKNSAVKLAAPLDDVNMLTQWRKNKLVSGTYVDDGVTLQKTQFWEYELDTSVATKPDKKTDINDIEITVKSLKIST